MADRARLGQASCHHASVSFICFQASSVRYQHISSCGPIVAILDEVLLHCQNSSTLESAQALLYALTSNPKFSSALESTAVLNEILEDMGFSGLWRSCSFNFSQDQDRKCFILTEKLIEVSGLDCRSRIEA